MSQTKTRLGGLVAVLCVLGLMVAGATPAFAGHKDGHEQSGQPSEGERFGDSDHDGDADSDENTSYTEDNDTNDGNTPNNVEDDGDNKHPSGKDRSVENGRSGNQGKAESNPDDSKGPQRFEGARGDDKPNGPGGTDLADQDGNNGCGNDDDFDDDNNGHCGGKPRPAGSPSPSPSSPPTVSGKTCPHNESLPMDHPDCKPVTGGGRVCPTNSSLPMNHPDCDDDDDTVVGTEFRLCPAGTDFAGMPMANLEDCNKDDEVSGRTDTAQPLKTCPAGPFAGMPFMDADDCGFASGDDQEVLGGVITRNAVGGGALAAPATPGAAAPAAAGAALPFTGAGELLSIAGIALASMIAGALILRLRTAR